MSTWQDLVSTAVLGTERRAVPPAVAADTAAALEADVPADTAEEQLLVAAAVVGAWRRAGVTARPDAGRRPEPAPHDERPPAPPKAVQLLDLLLDGHAGAGPATADLVADWLARCQRSARRLPAGMLPRVLDAATATPALRLPAVAAGGPRLRWLAVRNPAWAWATDAAAGDGDPEQVWAEGSSGERARILAHLRASDPARARALLAETWPGEPASGRARFVQMLAVGLGPDDEAFLERALDDRSKAVRAAAAALLAALPTSGLARRMTERLRPLVSVDARQPRLARRSRPRLTVSLPERVDAAAARDGIVADGAPPGTGARAWTLIQLVGATPLRFWEEELAGGPEAIVPLGAAASEVLAGWVLAAARQRNAGWARELLRHRPDPGLVSVLPPEVAGSELGGALSRVDDKAAVALLAALPAPWPPTASRVAVGRLRAVEKRRALDPVLPVLATALDPAVAPEIEAWAGSLRADQPTRKRLLALAQTLSLRSAIAHEFA